MNNMIGKMLDNRYELLEVIGSGGMAVVYKAKCHRLNRLVAVKVLKSDLAEDADFRRRFRDESQAVAPRLVGGAVRFDDQPVEAQVHGLLRKRCYQFAFTADVARIAQQRQLRQPAAQFDRDVPLGLVAVDRAVVAAESAVDGSQPP